MDPMVMSILLRTKATREGHFVFKSKVHCDHYTRPDDLLPHASDLEALADLIALRYIRRVDAVMGPSFGGDKLAMLVAASRTLREPDSRVLWIPTRKIENDQQIVEPERGFERFLPGARVLVTDDVTTSGKSPGKVVALARSHGAEVVGVGAIASYGADIAAGADVPEATVLNVFNFKTYPKEECPQCAARVPIVVDRSLGHGWEFAQDNPNYPGGFVKLLD